MGMSIAEDYVAATGVSHSVRELVQIAFGHVGVEWQKYVRVDPALLRPAEVDHLLGAHTKHDLPDPPSGVSASAEGLLAKLPPSRR
jgi:GDP-D-mannose dehydratase